MRLKQESLATEFVVTSANWKRGPWLGQHHASLGDRIFRRTQLAEILAKDTGLSHLCELEEELTQRQMTAEKDDLRQSAFLNSLRTKITWKDESERLKLLETRAQLGDVIAKPPLTTENRGISNWNLDIDLSQVLRGAGNPFKTTTRCLNIAMPVRLERVAIGNDAMVMYVDSGMNLTGTVPNLV